MAGVLGIGTMTAGLSTAGMGLGQGAWEQVLGEGEPAQHVKFALAEAGGIGPFGVAIHLAVIMLQELPRNKRNLRARK